MYRFLILSKSLSAHFMEMNTSISLDSALICIVFAARSIPLLYNGPVAWYHTVEPRNVDTIGPIESVLI